MSDPRSIKSFTLVELLIVIAILAVLAATVVLVLNPAELLAQARDTQRMADLDTARDAVDFFIIDNPSASLGTSQRVYISIPDTSATCANITGLPTLPVGWQYVCVTAANLRNVNGTGWIPLDLSAIKGGSPMPYLPVDPSNDATIGRYYTYTPGGSYEFTALLEARKNFASIKDGGDFPEMYELGSDLSLLPVSRDTSLVGYWKLDEGSGNATADFSGKGNNGTLIGGPIWQSGANCKRGGCLSFDGSDDYVNGGHGSSLDMTDAVTVFVWEKISGTSTDYNRFVTKQGGFASYFATRYGDGFTVFYIDGVKNWVINGYPELQNGSWHQVAVTYDKNGGANNMRLYSDGALRASTTATGSLPVSVQDLAIGNASYAKFGGSLDEVRIYNRALTDMEIRSLYDSTK